MARLSGAAARLRALPGRARAALGLAVALIVGLMAWAAVAAAGRGDDGGEAAGTSTSSSTTLATGQLDLRPPEGWQPIPVPALGVGLAVPPAWEAVLLSPEGLATLTRSDPAVPGFADSARAAAAQGGIIYAAGVDRDGQVSDVVVRAAPRSGVTDEADLEAYARALAAAAGRSDPAIEVVDDAERPTVRLSFRAGAAGESAEGTDTLVLGPAGIVWSVTVTSDDTARHDGLVTSITDTLVLAEGG